MKHLTLEQCEKLKELGFPQNTHLRWKKEKDYMPQSYRIAAEEGYVLKPTPIRGLGTAMNVFISCPTLEEMIDWLGEDFREVAQYTKEIRMTKPFYASSFDGKVENGESPLEAVYNLIVDIKS